MKRLLGVLILLWFCNLRAIAAPDYNNLWQQGNQYYRQKQYDSAAAVYERLAVQQPGDAAVYYNLGNAYYRLNKLPFAILNYERALNINPGFRQAEDNLSLAQTHIRGYILPAQNVFFVSWWQSLTQDNNAIMWTIVSLIVFLLIILGLAVNRLSRRGKLIPLQVIILLSFCWVTFIVFAYAAANNRVSHKAAIIIQDNALLLPRAGATKPLATLPEGIKVQIRKELNGWWEVRLPDGRDGWLRQSSLKKI